MVTNLDGKEKKMKTRVEYHQPDAEKSWGYIEPAYSFAATFVGVR